MPLKAFISYSTTDKHIAGQVKNFLVDHRVETFLAHEDIHISQQWKERIIEELNQTDIFIPLLSAVFKESDWAPQELGIVLTRDEVLIIPLSIDGTVPFGFIAHIQGERIPRVRNYYKLLIGPIIDRFPHGIIPGLIERLTSAATFRTAEDLMSPLLPYFAQFNDAEIDMFIDASIQNGQIWDAVKCKRIYLPKFLDIHRSRIVPDKLAKIEYQIQHSRPYFSREDE